MPRDGSNIYHTPPGTPGIPNTTIASSPYNGYLADIEQDLNTPRPIVAGGTGANNARDAMTSLQGDVAYQVVTNYDSYPFISGSFYSAAGATSAPTANAFIGICYTSDPAVVPPAVPVGQNMFVEARDVTTGSNYLRQKTAGVWGTWALLAGSTTALDATYVNVTGDNMTGDLIITKTNPTIYLDRTSTPPGSTIVSRKSGLPTWSIELGNSEPETGGDAGANFAINRYSDSGTPLGSPLVINRAVGTIQAAAIPVASDHLTNKNYVDSTRVNRAGDVMSGPLTSTNFIAKTSGGSPSVTVWPTTGAAFGMWNIGDGIYKFGQVDAAGVPVTPLSQMNVSTVFQVFQTGAYKPGGGTWTDSSDVRIKNILGDYDSGLDTIKALRPVRYTFKGNDTSKGEIPENRRTVDENNMLREVDTKAAVTVPYGNSPHYHDATSGKVFVGLIAQEAEGVMPEIVTQREGMIDGNAVTDLRDVNANALTYALINAVKALAARIEALEAAP